MAWIQFNPNPLGNDTGDCVPRALCVVLDCSWDEAYTKLAIRIFSDKL